MEKLFIVALMFCHLLTNAQAAKSSKPKTFRKPPPDQYFAHADLCIDSAASQSLFYAIYEWAGTRYKYAGKTKKGIDCSAFAGVVYRNAYCIELSGGSKDLLKIATPVEKDSLREGDLLFFKIRHNQVSHVGVYLGNNKFAHASVKAGVTISDLNSSYYKKYFYRGGRISAGG